MKVLKVFLTWAWAAVIIAFIWCLNMQCKTANPAIETVETIEVVLMTDSISVNGRTVAK